MSEKKNPYAPILILGWTGLVLVTALVLITSWWGYFVSTGDGVVDYLTVVIIITLVWSVIALFTSAILDQNEKNGMTNEIGRFLVGTSTLMLSKTAPHKRFRVEKTGDPSRVAYGDTPEEAIMKFVRGDVIPDITKGDLNDD